MFRLSAWLAIAVAIPLATGQLWRNFDNLDRWPTWGVDILTAALLAGAGVLALRGAGRFLAPAWAFATALYLSSVASRVTSYDLLPQEIRARELQLTWLVAGLLAVSLAGLLLSLRQRPAG